MKAIIKLVAVFAATIAGLCSTVTSKAQNGDILNFGRDYTPSAETYQISCQGDKVAPDLHSGSMNFSIPVYVYEDPDFTIPVSLDYHYNGFKPGLNSGTVGLGWSLNCGGVITRDIYGKPDEVDYFQGAKSGIIANWIDSGHMTDSAVSENVSFMSLGDMSSLFSSVAVINCNGPHFDCNPDIMHLSSSCGGPSGDFMMLNDGTFRLLNPDIPFGEISIVENGRVYEGLEFSITVSDGTVYVYGGPSAADYSAQSPAIRHISAYKLRSITAPNGRVVTFNYSTTLQVNMTQDVYVSLTPQMILQDQWSYTHPLESVEIDGRTVIEFNYTEKSENEYDEVFLFGHHNGLRNITARESRLSSIIVRNDEGRIIQSAILTQAYTNHGNGCSPKMLLSSVQTLHDGTYSFEYDGGINQSFPDYKCTGLDHWGFWNGEYYLGVSDFVPINTSIYAIAANNSTDIYGTIIGNGRNPSFNHSKKGSLAKITYPTGGYTEIDYSQNTASWLFNRSFVGAGSIVNNSGFQVGGIRVSAVRNYDGESTWEITYDYCDSGTLYDMPRYGAACTYISLVPGEGLMPQNAVTFGNQCVRPLIRDGFIGYSHVIKTLPDGSSIDTRFNGDEDDWSNDNIWDLWANGNYGFGDEGSVPYYLFAPPSDDYCNYRGRIWKETVRDANGDEVSCTEYMYTDFPVENVSRVVNLVNSIAHLKCTYHIPFLTETITTVNGMTTVTEISYNTQGQRNMETVRDSYREEVRRIYTAYCHEQVLGTGLSPLKSAVRYTRSTVSLGGNLESEINRDTYYYETDPDHPNPQPIKVATVRDFQNRNTFISYDSNYRPVRVDYPGGRYIEYAWSTDGRYLMRSTSDIPGNTTTYQWCDLVGITGLTMPTGQSEQYGYDDSNRLESRCDSDGNMTVKYEYHFNNE